MVQADPRVLVLQQDPLVLQVQDRQQVQESQQIHCSLQVQVDQELPEFLKVPGLPADLCHPEALADQETHQVLLDQMLQVVQDLQGDQLVLRVHVILCFLEGQLHHLDLVYLSVHLVLEDQEDQLILLVLLVLLHHLVLYFLVVLLDLKHQCLR